MSAETSRRRPAGQHDKAGERRERLAAALRANLRRRKDQARARDAADGRTDPPEAPGD